jgi:hypothetical protein
MPKNASKYSASQLKRVKSRIISAAKKYGITINAKENYLSTEAFKVTENAGVVPGGVPLFKEDPYAMPPLAGFCVALNNRCFDVVVSSHMIDPADLEMIGHKAMAAACAAVATLDPDMDGDIDALGDDDDDDDDDSPQMKNAMDGMESCPVCNVPGCTCGPGCVCPPDASQHCGMGAESAPQTPTAQAAGDTTEEEAPAMAEETQTPEATETAAPSAVEAKLDALIAAIGGLAEKLTPAATESAPAAPVAEAEVAETEEARIERLVAEKLTEAVQAHVAKNGVERKGLVKEAAVGAPLDSFNAGEHELPEGWPQKPLHQYTREEQMRYLNPALEQAIMGRRSVYREQ